MRRFSYILLSVTLLLALAACTSGTSKNAPDPATVDVAASGKGVTLAVNQELLVSLPANPSTGFAWTVTHIPAFLKLEGEAEYKQDDKDKSRPGAGGVNVWRFKATAAGTDTLRFAYQRSWEKGVAPAQTVEYPLTVK